MSVGRPCSVAARSASNSLAEDARPGDVLAPVLEDRRAVRRSVLLIELVRELVQDDVVPVAGVARARAHGIPGEHDDVATQDSPSRPDGPSVTMPPGSRSVAVATYGCG